jgi:hypothetical protein
LKFQLSGRSSFPFVLVEIKKGEAHRTICRALPIVKEIVYIFALLTSTEIF